MILSRSPALPPITSESAVRSRSSIRPSFIRFARRFGFGFVVSNCRVLFLLPPLLSRPIVEALFVRSSDRPFMWRVGEGGRLLMADKLELMKRSFAKIKYSMPPRHATDTLAEQMCELSVPHSWPRIKDGALACLLTHLLLKVFFFSRLRQNATHPFELQDKNGKLLLIKPPSFVSPANRLSPPRALFVQTIFVRLSRTSCRSTYLRRSPSFVRSPFFVF